MSPRTIRVAVDDEPVAAEVRVAVALAAERAAQVRSRPAWVTTSTSPPWHGGGDVDERGGGPGGDDADLLGTVRPQPGRDVTGPLCLDLVQRQALPRADVGLAQPVVDHHRPDAEVGGDDRRGLRGAASGLDQMPSNAPSCSAATSAWRLPRSLRSVSACPCQRRAAFHSVSPWRSARTRVGIRRRVAGRLPAAGTGWVRWDSNRLLRRSIGTLTRCPPCDCSPRPARRPGTGRATVAGATVGEVLAAAVDGLRRDVRRRARHVQGVGQRRRRRPVHAGRRGDEVAVLPPVSGG